MTNTQVKLAARPVGNPQQSDFSVEEAPMPTPNDGEVLIKTQYISLDPAMRGWMNEGKSYIAPIKIGDVFRAGTAGKVVESRNPDFVVGDYVTGGWGVQRRPRRTALRYEWLSGAARTCRYASSA